MLIRREYNGPGHEVWRRHDLVAFTRYSLYSLKFGDGPHLWAKAKDELGSWVYYSVKGGLYASDKANTA